MGINVTKLPEYDDHKAVVFVHDRAGRLRGFIAIHRAGEGNLSFGGTRFWKYSDPVDALRDALHLSKMMSYKCALAGFSYGGAKGVIIDDPELGTKGDLLKLYAKHVDYLGGRYISGPDVGLSWGDVQKMYAVTPHVGGFSRDITVQTGLGLFYAIEVSLQQIFGSRKMQERTIALQGLGKIGMDILERLYPLAASVVASDLDPKKCHFAKKKFPNIRIVSPEQIYREKVDIFLPCALGGVLNESNVSKLGAKIVCGAANNQLQDQKIGNMLHKRGILYAPDYIVNAGGLVSVIDEYEHKDYNEPRLAQRLRQIEKTLSRVFRESQRLRVPTGVIADRMAEKIFNKWI